MVAIGVLWPGYSVKIKKNNLKNERAHSVSIDFHYPATYSFVSLGIFDNESSDKPFSLLNCASFKSFQLNKIKIICASFE